jgi:probable HAF family extracellular repeat protein
MFRPAPLAALACAALIVSCDRGIPTTPTDLSRIDVVAYSHTATDLGALTPTDSSAASAVNDTGIVVGFSQATAGTNAVLWLLGGSIFDLGRFTPGTHAVALGVNIHATVVGFGDSAGGTRPFFWRPGQSQIFSLPLLFSGNFGTATGVNDSDIIVGSSDSTDIFGSSFGTFAVRWDAGVPGIPGAPTKLNTLLTGFNSFANGINDRGVIVGWSNDATFLQQAVRWSPAGAIAALTRLPGSILSEATAINERNEIVGVSFDGVASHAVFWRASGAPRDLGTLPGGDFSRANGINRFGDVVGVSTNTAGELRAVVWRRNTFAIHDLGTLPGRTMSQATGINRREEIVGSSGSLTGPLTRATCWSDRRRRC